MDWPCQRLILYLSCAAALDTLPYLLGGQSGEQQSTCIFQAFWMTMLDWSVLAWVCCMTFNLYINVVHQRATDGFERYYHLVAWGVPFALAIIPLAAQQYGPAGAWWYVRVEKAGLFHLLGPPYKFMPPCFLAPWHGRFAANQSVAGSKAPYGGLLFGIYPCSRSS